MYTTKSLRLLPVTFGVLAIIATAALPGTTRAKEPKPPGACAAPTCATCTAPTRTTRTLVAEEHSVPFLSQIPYLGRLFKNVGYKEVERIGVDFDFDVQVCPDCPQACKPDASAGVCQSSGGPKLFVIRKTAGGQMTATCSSEEPCCGKECALASPCCDTEDCEIICEEDECDGLSWERIIELTAKNAALEAVLEAREAFDEEKSDLIESLAMSMVEKAKLEGKVETQAAHAELTKEMLALATENGRLKAQVEMAEAKLALVQEMAKLAVENEQLNLAIKSRSGSSHLADDVQFLPPAPQRKPVHTAPTRAQFEETEVLPPAPASIER